MKFALGGLSPREFGVASLSEVIYKAPSETIGRSAYVSIQFDNTDRRIPIDSDAVTVSREFSKGGEGVYRLNGRKVSRKQITDALSASDIHVTGYNIVPQHAVTRMADVTTEERRRMIEDLIGIAVYDDKKAEASLELSQADVNLKVASAKTDEVRAMVEDLEKQRNDFLRHEYLNNEVKELQGKLLSRQIRQLEDELRKIKADVEAKQSKLEHIKNKRDELSSAKNEIEKQRRKFEEQTVDKGRSKIFEVERAIGDVKAQLAGLKAEMNSAEANLKAMAQQKESLATHLQELGSSAGKMKYELRKLNTKRDRLTGVLEEKKKAYTEALNKTRSMREELGLNTKHVEALENEIEELNREVIGFNAQIKGSSTELNLIASHIQTLETKRSEYGSIVEEIKARLKELGRLRGEELKRLDAVEKKLSDYDSLKESRRREVSEALEIVKKARGSIIEFQTQRTMAEVLGGEEKALAKLEEMGRVKAIQGIYGRLKSLVKFDESYRVAVESASDGWLNALVVKDLKTAISCVESLKRTKIGRVKIIPLESVALLRPIEKYPEFLGVVGPITDFIKCDEDVTPAVNFVFGDTVLVSGQKTAFQSAMSGVRAVATTGDLYESGGGMESGYFQYREQIDLESLVLQPSTLDSLDRTVRTLESLIGKGETEIDRLDSEIVGLRESRVQSQNMVTSIQGEIEDIGKNLARIRRALTATERGVKRLILDTEKGREHLSTMSNSRGEALRKFETLQREKMSLKLKTKPSTLIEAEKNCSMLLEELNELQQKKAGLDVEISSLDSSLKTLLPSLDQTRIQYRNIKRRMGEDEAKINELKVEIGDRANDLAQLESEKAKISETLTSLKDRREEFELELKKIESQLKQISYEYDPLISETNELIPAIKEREIKVSLQLGSLRELGYDKPMEVESEDIKGVESTLNTLRRELDSIGAVNQLAVTQFEQKSSDYKQLSTRISELENEKLAIINFMDELDRQKKEAFMEAFKKINENFSQIFSKITEGGTGRLLLENPEDPFAGGVDLFLRYTGKAEVTIGSASGGEKSVATVCFILALQSIHPMPFYMFDEIDAHMDLVNSQKLAELLRSRSEDSQFIVVSLKDSVISRASKVYGIFAREGVSQVVSLPTQMGGAVDG